MALVAALLVAFTACFFRGLRDFETLVFGTAVLPDGSVLVSVDGDILDHAWFG